MFKPNRSMWKGWALVVGALFVLSSVLTVLPGCSTGNSDTSSTALTTGTTPIITSQATQTQLDFDIVQQAALGFFSSGKPLVTNADALWKNINDGDSSNDPFILSIRSPADYAKGHIPGAVNIPLADLFKAESLDSLPDDKQIVVYCYTGNTAQIGANFLNLMGYDAVSLRYSMMAWTKNTEVQDPKYNWDPAKGNDFRVETEARNEAGVHALPAISTGATDKAEVIRVAAQQAFNNIKGHTVASADIFKTLNDGDSSNDPFLVDIRKAEDYAKGHLPGAVNITSGELFKLENLSRLPTDRQIVVNCYTGQTSQLVATALRTLGYNAASLKFGIQDWSKNDGLLGSAKRWSPDTEQWDYRLEK